MYKLYNMTPVSFLAVIYTYTTGNKPKWKLIVSDLCGLLSKIELVFYWKSGAQRC
jgi:hypothetical protein